GELLARSDVRPVDESADRSQRHQARRQHPPDHDLDRGRESYRARRPQPHHGAHQKGNGYLRRWFGRGFWLTTLAGFGLSLALELTQLTGIWGIYAVRYRSFDVDDLVASTLGASLGWLLAPLVVLLPARRHTDNQPAAVGSLSPGRRFLALLVDSICWVLAYLVGLFTSLALLSGFDLRAETLALGLWSLTFGLVFVLAPALADGSSPGRALLGSAVRRAGGADASWWRYLLRESVLLWPIGVVPGLGARVDAALPDHPLWMLAVVFGLPVAWLGVLGLVSLLRADRLSLPDLIAGTRVVMR
ncbi:MAG TPA: VanZ family protein, partial [Propionicimonas sp.]|nr:VanZ family protein [Propionicimonas sp.]